MEGRDSFIQIKGIVRNTAGSASEDGELYDVVNLRFRDGSWRPINDNVYLKGLSEVVLDYSYIYVHANNYKHMLGYRDNVLYWIATYNRETDAFELNGEPSLILTGQVDNITQMGNIITVAVDGLIKYALFSNGEYLSVDNDYNGAITDTQLIPDCNVELRVVPRMKGDYPLGFDNQVEVDYDVIQPLLPVGGKASDALIKEVEGLMATLRGYATDKGFFTGSFFACTAVELFDGNYVLMSRPVLMNYPFISNSGVTVAVTDNSGQPNLAVCNKIIYDEGTEAKKYEFTYPFCFYNYHNVGLVITQDSQEVSGQIYSTAYRGNYRQTNVIAQGFKLFQSDYFYAGNTYQSDTDDFYVIGAFLCSNQLQYKVNMDYNTTYSELIKNICVFITREVYPQDIPNMTTGHFPRKSFEDMMEELNEDPTFYKVLDINYRFARRGDWKSVDLSKKLRNLVQQDVLPVMSNGERGGLYANVFTNYNGKLHVANIKQQLFHGFPIGYFKNQGTLLKPTDEGKTYCTGTLNGKSVYLPYNGQYGTEEITIKSASDRSVPKVVVKVYLFNTTTGSSTVLREVVNNGSAYLFDSLMQMLSYPSLDAQQISIYINTDTGYYYLSLPLKGSEIHNYSYHISERAINLEDFSFMTGNPYVPEEDNIVVEYGNRIKLSAVDNPLFFPNETTYQIGNTEIIGFASSTVALSTGQFGAAPLLVFTKDGVYGLFVDASGELTYTNSRPICRDVCNNPQSIISIDDGVLFSTDRGLMLLERNAIVRELSESVEGKIIDLIDNRSGNYEYLKQVDQATNNAKLVTLQKQISKVEFKEYLKGANIAYNYFDREIMVSNSEYDYTYCYSNGYWYKRGISYQYFVNDYPFLYSLSKQNRLLNLSEESSSGNDTMILSRPIKLGTQEFKNGFRLVVRGIFAMQAKEPLDIKYTSGRLAVFLGGPVPPLGDNFPVLRPIKATVENGRTYYSIDFSQTNVDIPVGTYIDTNLKIQTAAADYAVSDKVKITKGAIYTYAFDGAVLPYNTEEDENILETALWEVVCDYKDGDTTYNVGCNYTISLEYASGTVMPPSYLRYEDNVPVRIKYTDEDSNTHYFIKTGPEALVFDSIDKLQQGIYTEQSLTQLQEYRCGLYVFGSYDNRRYSLIGAQEKSGTFRDLGCKIERIDVKYIRVLIVGDMRNLSSFEYIELTAKNQLLKNKIR